MKIFRIALMVIGFALIVYNATKLDFDNLFEGDSQVALIGILAAACAIILVLILNASLAIKSKSKRKS